MNKIALVIVLSAVVATASSQGAFAETEYQKFKRVERDNRDIHIDSREIRADRADLRRDDRELREDRQERNYAAGKELKAVVHGNFASAEYWDAQRRREQRDVNFEARDVRHDRADLLHDRFDRGVDVIKRNYDTSKL
jgi:hypothetical protein